MPSPVQQRQGERLERAITTQAEVMDKRLATQAEVLDKRLTKALNALTVSNFRAVPQADTDERTCFRCGKPGHVIKNCPEPKETTRAPICCPRCRKEDTMQTGVTLDMI